MEAEQAARAAEDARLRELYPLPEDDEEYANENYDENYPTNNSDQAEDIKEDEIPPTEERAR